MQNADVSNNVEEQEGDVDDNVSLSEDVLFTLMSMRNEDNYNELTSTVMNLSPKCDDTFTVNV